MIKVKLKRPKIELLSRALDKMKLCLSEVRGDLYSEDKIDSRWLYLVPKCYELEVSLCKEIGSFNGRKILKDYFVHECCGYCGVFRGTSEQDVLDKLSSIEKLFFEDPSDPDATFTFKSIAYHKSPEQLKIELDLDGEDNGQR